MVGKKARWARNRVWVGNWHAGWTRCEQTHKKPVTFVWNYVAVEATARLGKACVDSPPRSTHALIWISDPATEANERGRAFQGTQPKSGPLGGCSLRTEGGPATKPTWRPGQRGPELLWLSRVSSFSGTCGCYVSISHSSE